VEISKRSRVVRAWVQRRVRILRKVLKRQKQRRVLNRMVVCYREWGEVVCNGLNGQNCVALVRSNVHLDSEFPTVLVSMVLAGLALACVALLAACPVSAPECVVAPCHSWPLGLFDHKTSNPRRSLERKWRASMM